MVRNHRAILTKPGIKIRRVHRTPVFTPQARRKLSLGQSRFLPSFSEHLAKSLHSDSSAPATAAAYCC
jgi:hypothetical protein